MYEHGDASLLKHVITTVSSLLPSTVKFMKEAATRENKALWDALIAFIAEIGHREARDDLDPASSQAYHKIIETLVLLACDVKYHTPHPFLNGTTLPKLARGEFDGLTGRLARPAEASSQATRTRVASVISTVATIGVRAPVLRVRLSLSFCQARYLLLYKLELDWVVRCRKQL